MQYAAPAITAEMNAGCGINTAARAETLHYAAIISCGGAASAQYRIPFLNPVGEL